MGRLSALSVKNLSQPGRHGDGDGLYLHIAPAGTKSWVQRIVIRDKRRDIGLGSYPGVSLAQARSLASANRSAVSEGRDPLEEKREAREAARSPSPTVPTFADAALRVIELRRPTWSNPKHAAQWRSTLETYAFPALGKMTVDSITASDSLAAQIPDAHLPLFQEPVYLPHAHANPSQLPRPAISAPQLGRVHAISGHRRSGRSG